MVHLHTKSTFIYQTKRSPICENFPLYGKLLHLHTKSTFTYLYLSGRRWVGVSENSTSLPKLCTWREPAKLWHNISDVRKGWQKITKNTPLTKQYEIRNTSIHVHYACVHIHIHVHVHVHLYYVNMNGVNSLWCSSTVWLPSTFTWMNEKAFIYTAWTITCMYMYTCILHVQVYV